MRIKNSYEPRWTSTRRSDRIAIFFMRPPFFAIDYFRPGPTLIPERMIPHLNRGGRFLVPRTLPRLAGPDVICCTVSAHSLDEPPQADVSGGKRSSITQTFDNAVHLEAASPAAIQPGNNSFLSFWTIARSKGSSTSVLSPSCSAVRNSLRASSFLPLASNAQAK